MKLFERMIDLMHVVHSRWTRVYYIEPQLEFQPQSGTMDAIFAQNFDRGIQEKKESSAYGFLDLQKAFDYVPRQCICWALRSKASILRLSET